MLKPKKGLLTRRSLLRHLAKPHIIHSRNAHYRQISYASHRKLRLAQGKFNINLLKFQFLKMKFTDNLEIGNIREEIMKAKKGKCS